MERSQSDAANLKKEVWPNGFENVDPKMFYVRTNFPIQNLAAVCAGVGSLNKNDVNRDRIFFIKVLELNSRFCLQDIIYVLFPFKIPRMVDIVMKMVKSSLVHLLSRVIVICHYWIYGAPRRMLKLLLLGNRCQRSWTGSSLQKRNISGWWGIPRCHASMREILRYLHIPKFTVCFICMKPLQLLRS